MLPQNPNPSTPKQTSAAGALNPAPATPRTALLVLGMHRSGTSALTRILNLLGADLPANLMPAVADNNEAGFWESRDFADFNDEILQSAGSRWDDWLRFNPDWYRSPVADGFVDRAVELLNEHFSKSSFFVLKDPRMCRLLPFWQRALTAFDTNVLCVIPVRNPLDVAASLRSRDGFSAPKSTTLWLRHILDAEAASRPVARAFLIYDEVVDDWRAVIGRISNELDIHWPRRSATAEVEIEAFLGLLHRHHYSEIKALESNPFVSEWVRTSYGALIDLCQGNDPEQGMLSLDDIRERLDQTDLALGALFRSEEMARKESDAERDAVLERSKQLETGLAELESHAKGMEKAREEDRAEILSLRKGLSSRDETVADLKATANDWRSQAEQLRSGNAQLQSSNEQLQSRTQQLQSRAEQLQASIRRQESMLPELEGRIAEKDRGISNLQAGLAEWESHARNLEPALAESRAQVKQLESETHTLNLEIVHLKRTLEDTRNQEKLHRRHQADLAYHLNKLQVSAAWPLMRSTKRFEEHWPKLTRGLFAAPKVAWWGLSMQLPRQLRSRESIRTVLQSGLFDEGWYLENNTDVVTSGYNPLFHWMNIGWRQRLSPHPLFDTDWYLSQNKDIAESGTNPLLHYIEVGGNEGRDPNILFDGRWYLAGNPDVARSGLPPLTHYLRHGGQEGRNPHPLFDANWYLQHNQDVANARLNPLLHYLRFGAAEGRDPHPLFDATWYLANNPDIAEARLDPFIHFLRWGAFEGRSPNPLFNAAEYIALHPEIVTAKVNPLVHYLEHGGSKSRTRVPPAAEVPAANAASAEASRPTPADDPDHAGGQPRDSRPRQALEPHGAANTSVGPVDLTELAPPARSTLRARLIAFYLPQYHPIPENDEWWGKGFTEWRNVVRGQPRFSGHYQPHVPGELGFYDLRLVDVQRRQVELAKLYGISGFCFYFYWFAGKRLLEQPVRQYLEHTELELPFCLCWANENWSRRWDGREQDVLIAQEHSDDDDLHFIAHIGDYLRDPRYIRIDGRPLLLVYRPSLLPSPKDTAARWRSWCRDQGIGEIFLAYTQSFEKAHPAQYGFDAAVEFPPNYSLPLDITSEIQPLDPEFQGRVYDWTGFVRDSRHYQTPDYTLFRGVCPSWDNEARRPAQGATFHGASPSGYREWLENAVCETEARVADPQRRIIFANAWNEWAEGAHLEPDQRFGYAYLQATRDALTSAKETDARKIVVVSHDANLNGAQFLALNMARQLKETFGYTVVLIVLGPGPLLEVYSKICTVKSLAGSPQDGEEARTLAGELFSLGYRDAIVNSTASGLFTTPLKDAGFNVTSLIHELPALIKRHALEPHVSAIAASANHAIFPAQVVRRGFESFHSLDPRQVRIRPQGLYKRNALRTPQQIAGARDELRNRFGLERDAKVIIGVGYGDHRKGLDLFVDSAIDLVARRPECAFIWVGDLDIRHEQGIMERAAGDVHHSRIYFPGQESNTDLFYAGADVYALTSREDPFPSVVLEALDVGVPVVGFEGAGGFVELAEHECVRLAPAYDAIAFADIIDSLLSDEAGRTAAGEIGRSLVAERFEFRHYLFDLLALTSQPLPRVSVIVPNFNYLRYLPSRIASITQQSMPIFELIVLDDASSDGSDVWLTGSLPEYFENPVTLLNETNSGSVFEQWAKGVGRASGDFVWIAEADDLADPEFLEQALQGFDDPAVVMSYTQSKQIDEHGAILCDHYLDYVSDVSGEHWLEPYTTAGDEEVREFLAVKNTIPNVSGVLFHRAALDQVLCEHLESIRQFCIAGDWATYIEILKLGKVAFSPRPLNLHRRHSAGVTISGLDERQVLEIENMQRHIRQAFDIAPTVVRKGDNYIKELRQRLT